MKANELRIGNLVHNQNNGEDYHVTSADIADMDNGIKHREPIDLTEEWLFRFWFDKMDNVLYHSQFPHFGGGLKDGAFHIVLRKENYPTKGEVLFFPFGSVKYVHRLQNIFFEITGEELTIKEVLNEQYQ